MLRIALAGLILSIGLAGTTRASAGADGSVRPHSSDLSKRTSASPTAESSPTGTKRKKPDYQFGIGGHAGLFEPADPVLQIYGNGLYYGGNVGMRIKSKFEVGLSAGAFSKTVELEEGTSTSASIFPIGLEAAYHFKAPVVQPLLGLFLGAVMAEFDPSTVTGSSTATSGISPAYGPVVGFTLPIGTHFSTTIRVGLLQASITEGRKSIPVGGTSVTLGTSFHLP